MAKEILSVEYSVASSLALQHHLTMVYEFPSGSKISFLYQGLHDTYLVSNGSIHLILRIYRKGWKAVESIKAETDVLLQLKQKGIDVAVPYKDRNGHYIQELVMPEGVRYAVVFMYAPGAKLKELTEETAGMFGRKLAALHHASCDMNHDGLQRYYYLGNVFNSALENISTVMNDARIMESLRGLYFKMDSYFAGLETDDLKVGICHGDPHPENAHYKSESGKLTFFDFDFCGNGYLLYDVGSFCHYERNNERNVIAFLKGYNEILPLSKTEQKLIPFFTLLMRVFHLGARARNADGVRNPLWPKAEIIQKLQEIERDFDSI
jgi:Ser/Thr protein kinase RdoA (MazF antagonist)